MQYASTVAISATNYGLSLIEPIRSVYKLLISRIGSTCGRSFSSRMTNLYDRTECCVATVQMPAKSIITNVKRLAEHLEYSYFERTMVHLSSLTYTGV